MASVRFVAASEATVFVNVPVSASEKKRIEGEEESWTARKMIPFGVVFLGICIVALYCLSNYTEWMAIAKP